MLDSEDTKSKISPSCCKATSRQYVSILVDGQHASFVVTESTERVVRGRVKLYFGAEERNKDGNALASNPAEHGPIQTGVETAVPSLSGEKKNIYTAWPGRGGVCPSQKGRRFYQKPNAYYNGFALQAEINRKKVGTILSFGCEWYKQYFDEFLNGVENLGTVDQGNERIECFSAAEDGHD